jgi:GTP-binding protein
VFVDEAEIDVRGGDGGNGAVSLRREKHVPRGGPDGGDGGHGGGVVVVAAPHLRTLVDLTYRSYYRAENGGHGGPKQQRGRDGAKAEIRLPLGTIVREAGQNLVIADLSRPEQEVVVAKGGRGGRGNARFATPTRRTPRFAEKGEPGQARRLVLELKLLADVGLVGLPNSGKSSLLARVSAARPKIADYPFTTLAPNLGVVRIEEGTSFVVADIPGLVEGAHQGLGRGHDFLRHIERTRLLIHLLDVGSPDGDPREDFAAVSRELGLYRPGLSERPRLVALNKIDLRPSAARIAEVESFLREQNCEVFAISALSGEGVRELMGRAAQMLEELPREAPATPSAIPVVAAEENRPLRVSQLSDGLYGVAGTEVERAVVMTDLDNDEAVRHLHRRLQRMGVIRRLRRLGAKDGDRVRIGAVELDFVD